MQRLVQIIAHFKIFLTLYVLFITFAAQSPNLDLICKNDNYFIPRNLYFYATRRKCTLNKTSF